MQYGEDLHLGMGDKPALQQAPELFAFAAECELMLRGVNMQLRARRYGRAVDELTVLIQRGLMDVLGKLVNRPELIGVCGRMPLRLQLFFNPCAVLLNDV